MQYYYNRKDLPLSTSVINAYIVQVLCNQAVASMRCTEALVSFEISCFFFVFFCLCISYQRVWFFRCFGLRKGMVCALEYYYTVRPTNSCIFLYYKVIIHKIPYCFVPVWVYSTLVIIITLGRHIFWIYDGALCNLLYSVDFWAWNFAVLYL